MNGLIFHTLRGIKGWSYLSISKIDVFKIKKINYRKRLFCIFDRDYPYTLEIEYDEPNEYYTLAPVFGGNRSSSAIVKQVDLTQIITKRYKTEFEIKIELNELEHKQNKINKFQQELINKINEIDE